jgi:hypothetical protein
MLFVTLSKFTVYVNRTRKKKGHAKTSGDA